MAGEMTLQQRKEAFDLMQLPGQPMMMHMGTSHLVGDLWREIQRLNAALSMTREGVEPDEAKRIQKCET